MAGKDPGSQLPSFLFLSLLPSLPTPSLLPLTSFWLDFRNFAGLARDS